MFCLLHNEPPISILFKESSTLTLYLDKNLRYNFKMVISTVHVILNIAPRPTVFYALYN